MQRLPVSSSAFRSMGYDEKTQQLEVEFTNGRVYRYPKRGRFPKRLYTQLINADSIGTLFGSTVRPNFEAIEVEPAPRSNDDQRELLTQALEKSVDLTDKD